MTILVHHIGALGDTIVTIPALRAVRAAWPAADVVMLHDAPRRPGPGVVSPARVLEGTGLVDRFLPYARDLGGPALVAELWRVWRSVRALAPAAAVFVGPSERDASALRRDRALLRSAGVRRFVGFGAAPRSPAGEGLRKLARLAQDGVATAADASWLSLPFLTVTPADLAAVDTWLDEMQAPRGRLIAIAPETRMNAKLWPAERFAEIGRRLVERGWWPILIGAGVGPGSAGGWVERWRGGGDAGGRWDVPHSAALLSRCALYVGVDSGLAHLAAAVRCRTVVLTSGLFELGQWDPLGDGHTVLRHRTPCERCRVSECPVAGHPCMTGLSIDCVWDAVQRGLATAAASGEAR
ncbi:MAG: glycosyltransferase family 9 protein [Vicinamibacteraceae bacterium]